jgi:hypothetical protein
MKRALSFVLGHRDGVPSDLLSTPLNICDQFGVGDITSLEVECELHSILANVKLTDDEERAKDNRTGTCG